MTTKKVKGYPYSVSSKGKVINLKTFKKLKGTKDKDGYLRVQLYKDGHPLTISIHRLVALHFCKRKKGCDVVNHINKDRRDNRRKNLEWCSVQYNAEYSLSKRFVFLSPEGKKVEIFNLSKFCRENKLTKSLMCAVYKEHPYRHAHKGWRKFKLCN